MKFNSARVVAIWAGAGVNILHYSQRKIWEKFPIFQRLGKSFLIIEFARHLSRKAKYAFFLVITITISGKRKIFSLICLQYLLGDGGEMFPCWRGKVSLFEEKSFPVEGGIFLCLRVKHFDVGGGNISLLEGETFPC